MELHKAHCRWECRGFGKHSLRTTVKPASSPGAGSYWEKGLILSTFVKSPGKFSTRSIFAPFTAVEKHLCCVTNPVPPTVIHANVRKAVGLESDTDVPIYLLINPLT